MGKEGRKFPFPYSRLEARYELLAKQERIMKKIKQYKKDNAQEQVVLSKNDFVSKWMADKAKSDASGENAHEVHDEQTE